MTVSFWFEQLGGMPEPRPALEGRVEADGCIVGGGYVGLEMAQAGMLDAGCELMMKAVRKDRRWIETVRRLVQAGRLDADLAGQIEGRLTATSARTT